MEITNKHPAVSTSTAPDAPDATATSTPSETPEANALPTLRTRRMHSKSSISPFPQDSWLPLGTAEEEAEEESTTLETTADAPEASPTLRQVPLTPPVATPLDQEEFEASEDSVQSLIAEKDEPGIDALDTVSLPTPTKDQLATASTSELTHTPAFPISIPDEITSTPTGELAGEPVLSTSTPDVIPATPTDQLTNVPAFPVPVPETPRPATPPPSFKAITPVPETPRPATPPPSFEAPRPATPPPSFQATPSESTVLPPLPSSTAARKSKNRMVLVLILVALVILVGGGTGILVLVRQNASTGAGTQCTSQQNTCTSNTPAVHGKPTSLTLSNALTGTISIVAKPTCQISRAGDLSTLLVNLSGSLNNQLYNFGFTIQHYNGPGDYSNPAPDVTILFATPGDITNGWSNSDPTATGSITVERGEQTGNINYTLAGTGTRAKTQIQVSGNWTCGS